MKTKTETGGTKVFPCSCKNAWQDERYGKGQRVHNRTVKAPSGGGWRCTCCGNTRSS